MRAAPQDCRSAAGEDDGLDEATRRQAMRLQNLGTRLLRLARSPRGSHGISSAQYSALAMLYDRGAMSLVALARAERVTHPTMSRVVAGLERRGAVERSADAADRRSRRVALTEDGRALYERVCANRVALAGAILERLEPQSAADLLEVVAQTAEMLERAQAAD
jgi:DNA-binding MarR family transcriptional regulator